MLDATRVVDQLVHIAPQAPILVYERHVEVGGKLMVVERGRMQLKST